MGKAGSRNDGKVGPSKRISRNWRRSCRRIGVTTPRNITAVLIIRSLIGARGVRSWTRGRNCRIWVCGGIRANHRGTLARGNTRGVGARKKTPIGVLSRRGVSGGYRSGRIRQIWRGNRIGTRGPRLEKRIRRTVFHPFFE